ncbi:MAG TPA: hypothetical protein VK776_20100 [Bryobacteraceae bacterium]|nr:hypothetical protein [Bryobacteraceae bacterium]
MHQFYSKLKLQVLKSPFSIVFFPHTFINFQTFIRSRPGPEW